MILMYFTSTSSKLITIFNNNSSVNWTVINSTTAPTITIRNSYGSGTNWYLYGLKKFKLLYYMSKEKEILKVSNPNIVQKLANKTFSKNVPIYLSTRKDKKYMVEN